MAVKAWQLSRQLVVACDLLHELVVLAIMLQRRLAHEPAPFDAPMILRDRQRISPARFRHFDTRHRLRISRDEMRIRAGAQEKSIEAGLFADRSRLLAAVAERDRD